MKVIIVNCKIGFEVSNLDNINLQDFLTTLTRLELFALISFCFNYLILSAIVSTISILYGDLFIRYYNLEEKYPRLANIKSNKIKKYTLYYNVFLILFSVIAQLFACTIVFLQHFS